MMLQVAELLQTRDASLSAPALFLAGSVARAGRTEHPAHAAAIERLVLAASARARGTDEQLEALAALGNLGSATVLPRLRQAVTAGDPRVRAAATRALRLVPDREADRLLAVTLAPGRRSDRAGGGDLRRGLPTARAAGGRPRRYRPERSDRLRPCRRRHLAGAEPSDVAPVRGPIASARERPALSRVCCLPFRGRSTAKNPICSRGYPVFQIQVIFFIVPDLPQTY